MGCGAETLVKLKLPASRVMFDNRHRTPCAGSEVALQLLAAEGFTYNSNALKYLRGELAISMKMHILQTGEGAQSRRHN